MKWLLFLAICSIATAQPLATTAWKVDNTATQPPVKQGSKMVVFDLLSFSGTIGNATFSNATHVIQIVAAQEGDRLNEIPYTCTNGQLIIVDSR